MQRHRKKRIEIIIEEPILHRALDVLDRAQATGYTVLPALAGRGREGRWHAEGQISSADHRVLVICITDESKVEEILTPLYSLVSRQIGIITVSDVEVIRPEHF